MATRGPDPEVTDKEIQDAIDDTGKPFITTNDVVERVDLSDTRVRDRLDNLVENGILEKRKVGRSQIYWVPELESN